MGPFEHGSVRGAFAASLAMVLGACSAPRSTGEGGEGADASTAETTPTCGTGASGQPWLDAYLAERLAALPQERATPEGRDATRRHLAEQLASLGLATTTESYASGANVVARLPATAAGATEWVVVGAHFDAAAGSPGASDNGTGVAAVLAVARAAREEACRSRGAIFVFFDEEEVGLEGSKAFAERLVAEKTSVLAVHTVDQVGWDADGDRTFELERPTPALLEEYRLAAVEVGAAVVSTKTSATDHHSFRTRGFASVGVTEEYAAGDTSPHAHGPADTPGTVHAGYHSLGARLVASVVTRELR